MVVYPAYSGSIQPSSHLSAPLIGQQQAQQQQEQQPSRKHLSESSAPSQTRKSMNNSMSPTDVPNIPASEDESFFIGDYTADGAAPYDDDDDDGDATVRPRGSGARGAAASTTAWFERNSVQLLEACCNHDMRKARLILDRAEDANLTRQMVLARDDFRDSALHLASSHGEVDIVKLLLSLGADVNAENNLGSSPLNLAAVAGSVEVCTCVLWGVPITS